MLSNRPYLLRAFHEWIVDSTCTPILVLDAHHPQCKIPRDYIDGGEIVFNVSTAAVRDFKITNELVEFKASFSGVIHIISAPIKAILAIYAEENGEGLFLDAEETDTSGGAEVHPKILEEGTGALEHIVGVPPTEASKSKPFLKLVE